MKKAFINHKIIKNYIIQNLWLIIFFTIIFLIMNIVVIFINTLNKGKQGLSFFNNQEYQKNNLQWTSVLGYGNYLSEIFSASVILFSIFNLILINKIIVKEIVKGHILLLIATSNSRIKIILSKIVFLIFTSLIMFSPSFAMTIIYSIIDLSDNKLYIGRLITYQLSFITFMIFLILIFTFICQILIEVNYLGLILNILLLAYILTMDYIVDEKVFQASFFKYISPTSLCPKVLKFNDVTLNLKPKKGEISFGTLIIDNLGFSIASIFINLFLSILFMWQIIYNFSKKDLNI
ncbi:hypothetical protein [Spiroplasma endosymbiont of Aspidapion aeneum]|uniref:hypothetical protein n=1 Tax=Spiroplasma endosymbiont of Aspidapion aeneum TaxID=3066276 RepID=UPI00313D091E